MSGQEQLLAQADRSFVEEEYEAAVLQYTEVRKAASGLRKCKLSLQTCVPPLQVHRPTEQTGFY